MDHAFSAATRRADLDSLAAETVDLLVIGGGITGAGIARDAALRGLRTALLEAGDFGAGTSSRSSRLIHGGLRYLEHGWFRLVFEASRERRILLRIAPHLVRARPFLFPTHRAGRVRRWQISAAVWLYDLLGLFRNAGRHRLLSRRGVLRHEPHLRDRDLTGGALYWDAQCDDARLVLANVRDAHRRGARCASYARVVALDKAGGRVRGAEVADALSGRRFAARAHVVVNATGPWTDALRRLDDPAAAPLLRPTKGAHIAVPRARIANSGAVTLTSPIDGRVMFVLPWGEVTIVGTTDTDTTEAPDDVAPSREDVTYLLRSANAIFPAARLQLGDVIAAWAALRPLLHSPAADAGSVPREHHLEESPSGLLTITGGKLTTYRVMAAQTVDGVVRRLHALDGRHPATRARTDRLPLPGGELADLAQLVEELGKEGLPAPVAGHLATAYGSEAPAVVNLARGDEALAEPLLPGAPWLRAEVVHQARREMALTVADVLMRRIHVFHTVRDQGRAVAPDVARLLGRELGWSGHDEAAAVDAYGAEVAAMRRALRESSAR
jgi:glycerol-3-phosphate dehydrogenase